MTEDVREQDKALASLVFGHCYLLGFREREKADDAFLSTRLKIAAQIKLRHPAPVTPIRGRGAGSCRNLGALR